ncbi:hypothetical protein CANARDRAFT_26112 [[Candida] arabinofermentans NRRL YB-2248]|uniref:Sodium/calcium exchanger membrane region domain-containing protein n=1 Tax=[Candida] arabinofermentans NRRL YB-2248 TaxID=983967 RepID=A0A1E4T848_9ASCO|nr:hypothetical protein CANARDRAFT_26112 [[Candida] arabinofermentans NRRL YB-2248]
MQIPIWCCIYVSVWYTLLSNFAFAQHATPDFSLEQSLITHQTFPSLENAFNPAHDKSEHVLDKDTCIFPHNSTAHDTCNYIKESCDGRNFKYINLYYCSGVAQNLPNYVVLIGFLFIIIILLFILGLLASNYLTPNLTFIAKFLQLSDKLAGLTLISLANGSPDIASTYVAMNSHATSLAIGELLGSANFALTVVIGCMALIRPFKVDYNTFIKDMLLFGFLICLAFMVLIDGEIKLYESITMCLSYAIYIIVNLVAPERYFSHQGGSAPPPISPIISSAGIYGAIDNERLSVEPPRPRSVSLSPITNVHENYDDLQEEEEEEDTHDQISDLMFQNNVERLEQGQAFRLSLSDSIKLALRSWDTVHLKNYYSGTKPSLSTDIEHTPEYRPEPHRKVIIITTPTTQEEPFKADEIPSQIKSPKPHKDQPNQSLPRLNTNEFLNVPIINPLERSSSGSSLITSNSSILSSLSNTSHNKLSKITILNKILPEFHYVFQRSKPFESTLNILMIPVVVVFNLLIPMPSLQKREIHRTPLDTPRSIILSTRYAKEISVAMKLFYIQLFATPFLVSETFTLEIFGISIAVSLLNSLVQKIIPQFYTNTLFNPLASLVGFINVLKLITLTASEVIQILKNLAIIYQIKESLLGMTVLAVGNSIGDLITNTTLSSMGFALTGLHACFGSPLLYILFGIGLNSLIMNIKTGESVTFEMDSRLLLSSCTVLFVSLFYLAIVPRNGWVVDRFVGGCGVTFWILFNIVSIYFLE